MTREELLEELLRERFGKPVRGPTWPTPPAEEPWRPPAARADDTAAAVRRYELDTALEDETQEAA